MSTILELKSVSKKYGENQVLKDISLSIEKGKMYALLGRNGAGKSTLMRMLARYEQPDAGYGFILGDPLDIDRADKLHNIGYVSELIDYALPVPLEDYFACYKRLHKNWNGSMVKTFFEAVGVDPKKHFSQLSRGQRIQAVFGMVLASQPQILLLDEMTSVLDAHGRAYVMDQLGRYIRNGGAVLIATNIITELRNYPDHLCLLHQGQMKVNHPMAHLQRDYVKLRALSIKDHAVFADPLCFEVSMNTDGTMSYVLPRIKLAEYEVPDLYADRRGTTAEDFFIYFTRCKW